MSFGFLSCNEFVRCEQKENINSTCSVYGVKNLIINCSIWKWNAGNPIEGQLHSGKCCTAWLHVKLSQRCPCTLRQLSSHLLHAAESLRSQQVLSQEIPCILWNPMIHYCVHKCPTPIPILSPIDPIHAPNPTPSRSILILSYYLCMDLRSGFSASGFPTKSK
jgi:hypothetical protein